MAIELLSSQKGETGPVIRELTREEIESLRPDFEARGGELPKPEESTAIGIIDNGKIVGYQFLQLRLHAQPTKIEEGYSHLFSALCRKSEEIILAKAGSQWVYVFAPEELVPLAESRGMFKEPWIVMSKLVKHPEPPKPLDGVDLLYGDGNSIKLESGGYVTMDNIEPSEVIQ